MSDSQWLDQIIQQQCNQVRNVEQLINCVHFLHYSYVIQKIYIVYNSYLVQLRQKRQAQIKSFAPMTFSHL